MKNKEVIDYDVVIIGGGTAGFAAAVGAAQKGFRTLIIEENACLGGMATSGMVSMFMGFADGEQAPYRGVVGDVISRLQSMGACDEPHIIYLAGRKDAYVSALPYNSEDLKYVMDCMVKESGAEILFHTKVVGVEMENGHIKSVTAICGDKQFCVEGQVFIDASFHGIVATLADMPLQEDYSEDDLQPGSLMFKMANVNAERFASLSKEEKESLVSMGVAEHSLFVDNLLGRQLGHTGIFFHNMSRVSANVTDPWDWSKAEAEGREQVHRISRFLVNHVPGFENATLVSTGSQLGLRDSKRFKGKYTLTNEDVQNGTCFSDAVAVNSFPVDIHSKGLGYSFVKPQNGAFYVPYRCMVGDVNNLILTGRIISADRAAHACLRVMICCMRLGEAAGVAAAMSLDKNISVNVISGEKIGIM